MSQVSDLTKQIFGDVSTGVSRVEMVKRARSNYNKWSKMPGGRLTKAIIFALQDGRCADCKKPVFLTYHNDQYVAHNKAMATLDHIKPLSVTLKHDAGAEYQILCPDCNLRKGPK